MGDIGRAWLAGRDASCDLTGEYSVVVERDGERIHEFRGYADNPSDALEKAIEVRQEIAWWEDSE